ncbi:hypothetical protein, partial [Inquilinus sp. CAU 1745]|uniref:hypothetical protein n=1 Tax=Inquilinus sp. CAU 1745 TaxID=3140369 RepID=UPI00325A8E9D
MPDQVRHDDLGKDAELPWFDRLTMRWEEDSPLLVIPAPEPATVLSGPGFTVSEHGVEVGEELSGDGDDGDFL